MLTSKTIKSYSGTSTIDDTEVITMSAVVSDDDENNPSVNTNIADTEVYEANKETCNADLSEFIALVNAQDNTDIASGTFTTSDTQYGTTSITLGFEPRLVYVTIIDEDSNLKYAIYDTSMSGFSYLVNPASGVTQLSFDATEGEGISNVDSTSFTFMTDTDLGCTCTYLAIKSDSNE